MRGRCFLATVMVLALPIGRAACADEQSMAAAMARARAGFVSRSAALQIRDVRFSPQPARQFRKLEITFALEASYRNPFDPREIDVEARITLPSGAEISVPAFFFIPYKPASGVTQLQGGLRFGPPTGEPCWKVRFAPPEPGEYAFRLVAHDARGRTASSESYRLRVAAGPGPGFLRVARDNPAYFEDSAEGSLFWATGANVAWTRSGDPGTPCACYEYYFGRARGLMSATRVWMCHWAWLEWTPQVQEPGTTWAGYAGAGYYNQMIAAEFDRVFALAEENGLRVMLVTDDNNEQGNSDRPDEWGSNPYNRKNGGPCDSPDDFFTSAEARRLYRNRLRYIVARWGYSTALWAIDSWNDESDTNAAVRAWLAEMRDSVHALVRGYRPLIYGSNFQANDLMDYAQAGPGAPAAGKPAVAQECEFTENRAWFVPTLRHAIWEGLAEGEAGVMVWPHPLVDALDAWSVFRPPLRFLADLPLNRGHWTPLRARVISARAESGRLLARTITIGPAGDVSEWGARAPRDRFPVDLSRGEQALPGLCPTLYGGRRAEWRNPPTFLVDLPGAGELVLEVEEIGGGDQLLEVTVDGRPALSRPLRGGRRELPDAERWVPVPLPPGRHAIRIDNAAPDGDWIRVRRAHFVVPTTRGADLVQARGLGDGTGGFLYLQNRSFARLPQLLGQRPVPLQEVVVEMAGLRPGRYRAACFDTTTGAEVSAQDVVCREGLVVVTLRGLEEDLALKLQPVLDR